MKYITQKMWRLENLELPWSIQKPIAVSLSSPEQTFEAIERIDELIPLGHDFKRWHLLAIGGTISPLAGADRAAQNHHANVP